jgi:hypothetical protein
MTGACCELTWLRHLLRDLGISHQESAYCDNDAGQLVTATEQLKDAEEEVAIN